MNPRVYEPPYLLALQVLPILKKLLWERTAEDKDDGVYGAEKSSLGGNGFGGRGVGKT